MKGSEAELPSSAAGVPSVPTRPLHTHTTHRPRHPAPFPAWGSPVQWSWETASCRVPVSLPKAGGLQGPPGNGSVGAGGPRKRKRPQKGCGWGLLPHSGVPQISPHPFLTWMGWAHLLTSQLQGASRGHRAWWVSAPSAGTFPFDLTIVPGVGFRGGSDVKASACNARDLGLIPGLGRAPGEGNGNPLQYPCLGNSLDRGAWWAIVHRVTKSWTWLSN